MTSDREKAPPPVDAVGGAEALYPDGYSAKHTPAGAQSKAAAALAARWARVTPHWLRGDPAWLAYIGKAIADEVGRLVATEGLSAMEMPRSAACAHEAGHAVVDTALGMTVTRVEIMHDRRLTRISGLQSWGGLTTVKDGAWCIAPDTPADEIRRRVCHIVAGLAAERVLDPGGVRGGSSLDELVGAQAIATALHNREQYCGHPKQTFNACWEWTAMVIKVNDAVARQLMGKLDLMGSIQGKPLAAILRQVRTPPPELMQHLVERSQGRVS